MPAHLVQEVRVRDHERPGLGPHGLQGLEHGDLSAALLGSDSGSALFSAQNLSHKRR